MNFEEWWKTCITQEAKEDMQSYYGLSKDRFYNFAKKAGIANNMSNDVEACIYSEVNNSIKNPELKFIFEWVDTKKQKTLFQKDLGRYTVNHNGFLEKKEEEQHDRNTI